MSIAQDIQNAIGQVSDQESFIQRVLVDTLNWELDPDALDIEDTAYEYTADELNSPLLDEKCNGRALQLTFQSEIPWGVFLIEFAHEEPFIQSRGLTMPLRQLLNALVPKRRRDSGLPAWDRENLLFICTYDYRHFRFAYFQAAPGKEKTAPLKLFGWNEGDTAVRTLCEHNLPHLRWDHTQNWPEAFNIEKVTKDFYRDYADVFRRMEDTIGEHNDIAGDELRMFTQMLFNRLMFLRFIERKGWLELGNTPDYLANLYASRGLEGQSFYASRLMPLFFEGLAVEGKQESPIIGKVPFLNGGLFERADLDEQVDDIPDEAFEPVLGPRGLFYHYNFTISESTPLDIEVAVDPEMLGKVFEELVTGRHESGSYYTPRPVVAFMCREALKGYLTERTDVPADAVALLVDQHDASSIREGQREPIEQALDAVKACDPACGSGAYLLGLMQELIAIRRALQSEKLKADPQFLYKLKLHIISHNLYGVDIDPFATNIAMLRLWLSLSVEADVPEPLPNLDFKIETGDSLLGPCREFQKDFSAYLLERRAEHLVEKKDEYLRAHGPKKQQLYDYIRKEEDDIGEECRVRHGKGVIAWPVHFAEVFFRKRTEDDSPALGGFDIVLANPPYVRKEDIPPSAKTALKANFATAITGRSDLYCSFYARAVQMLRPGGMHVFVCSSAWLDAQYGVPLQDFLLQETDIHAIYDSAIEKQFSTANVNTIISVLQKRPNRYAHPSRFTLLTRPFLEAFLTGDGATKVVIDQDELRRMGLTGSSYTGGKWGGKYLRAPDIYKEVFGELAERFVTLGEMTEVVGYIHDNNTGGDWPPQDMIWSLRDAECIDVNRKTPGIRRCGVKPSGNSTLFAPILFPRTFGTRHLVLWARDGVLGKEFYRVVPHRPDETASIVAQLNSTLGILQREILGIKGLGGGALKFAAADVSEFQIVPGLDITRGMSALKEMCLRPIHDIDDELSMDDRHVVDEVIFDAIGLGQSQRQAVYAAAYALVNLRRSKAKTVTSS